jgi:hypothetical protein
MNLVVVTDLFFPDRNLAKEHQNTTQNGPSQTTDTIRYEPEPEPSQPQDYQFEIGGNQQCFTVTLHHPLELQSLEHKDDP